VPEGGRSLVKWRLKSHIQSAVAALPSDLSYALYYFLQRRWGRADAWVISKPRTLCAA
jgi:hypothetical protein